MIRKPEPGSIVNTPAQPPIQSSLATIVPLESCSNFSMLSLSLGGAVCAVARCHTFYEHWFKERLHRALSIQQHCNSKALAHSIVLYDFVCSSSLFLFVRPPTQVRHEPLPLRLSITPRIHLLPAEFRDTGH